VFSNQGFEQLNPSNINKPAEIAERIKAGEVIFPSIKHSWTVVVSSFHRFDSCFFLFELPRCFFSEPAHGAPQINHHQRN